MNDEPKEGAQVQTLNDELGSSFIIHRWSSFIIHHSSFIIHHWSSLVLTLLVAVVPTVLWPGDTPWILDEPAEVAIAWQANQERTLAAHGLSGNFYVSYGPLPMHVYQAILLLSHDPRVLVVLRGLLCSLMTAGSLLWLGRSLRFSPWFAAAVMLAPHLWINNRNPWAASLAIPVGMLALAAYASFLRKGSGKSLVLAVGAGMAPLFIHPQAGPLSAAILGHALWRRRGALWRHRLGVLGVVAMLGLLNARYLDYAARTAYKNASWSLRSGHPSHTSRLRAGLGPLMGGRLFSGGDFDQSHCHLKGPEALVGTARVLSSAAIPLVWLGVAVAAWRVVKRRSDQAAKRPSGSAGASLSQAGASPSQAGAAPSRDWAKSSGLVVGGFDPHPSPLPEYREREQEEPLPGEERRDSVGILSPQICPPIDTMAAIALGGLALQAVYFGLLRVPPSPHYFFGAFALHVLLAWVGVEALARLRLRGIVVAGYGLGLGIVTLGTMWQVHREGWAPGTMSPTLNEQIKLARELNHYSDARAWTDVAPYQYEYAHALWALRLLFPPEPGQGQRESGQLVIRYVRGPNGPTSRIELIEARSDADLPANAKRVALHYPWRQRVLPP